MNAPIPSKVELFFLGKRTYVQAPIQLRFALREIMNNKGVDDFAKITVLRYKQIRETKSPVMMVPFEEESSEDAERGNLTVEINGEIDKYKLLAIPGELRRLPDAPYRQEEFRQVSEYAAEAHVPEVSDFWALLDESIQLAKLFHISKYCQDHHYRFIVGGFEHLTYADPAGYKGLELTCTIKNQLMRAEAIYNRTEIKVTGDNYSFSFDLPFIGAIRPAE